MIAINPWLFLLLVFSAAGGYVGLVLYSLHWYLNRRPKQPSKLPPTILRP